MDEHDDDLESVVKEGAEKEADRYPDTEDELAEPDEEVRNGGDEDSAVDEDEAEL